MSRNLKRYQQAGELRFITFSCYRRLSHLGTPAAREQFERSLQATRLRYGFLVAPIDWPWSSFRHWWTGERGAVEIESSWTAMQREAAIKNPMSQPQGHGAPASVVD